MSHSYITTRISHIRRGLWKWIVMDIGLAVRSGSACSKASAALRVAKAKEEYIQKIARTTAHVEPSHAL